MTPTERFKVHPLPIVEPEHMPIPFDVAKSAYEAKHNKPLSLSLDMMARFIHQKELSALIVVLLMNIFPTITAIKNSNQMQGLRKDFSTQKAILSRLFENVLIVVISFL
ncbi:hypothetical protein SD457_13410 [Coprobacillaceae bacterium CR2/5/TPMF4]|nr:hypothetical protein SD457_13410 [Coprobacillaceae bacterium CR2/5/TPMF4]